MRFPYAKKIPEHVCRVFIACLFPMAATIAMASDLELDEYLQRANAAKIRGDWESVASQVAQAINHPDLPKTGTIRSGVHLEYGRAMGVLCQYREAEKYLMLAKEIADTSGSAAIGALYELGSVSVAQKKFAAAVGYFSQLVPMIERDSRSKPSPSVIADAYEKLSLALAETGKTEEAQARRGEADKIRQTALKAALPGMITPYGKLCPKS